MTGFRGDVNSTAFPECPVRVEEGIRFGMVRDTVREILAVILGVLPGTVMVRETCWGTIIPGGHDTVPTINDHGTNPHGGAE